MTQSQPKASPQIGDRIFVYGTLRLGERSEGMLTDRSKYIGSSSISGAVLYNIGSFPGLIINTESKSKVTGDVFEITHHTLAMSLDRYEGYPDLYDRIQVHADSGDIVWVYIFNRPVKGYDIIVSGDWKRR